MFFGHIALSAAARSPHPSHEECGRPGVAKLSLHLYPFYDELSTFGPNSSFLMCFPEIHC